MQAVLVLAASRVPASGRKLRPCERPRIKRSTTCKREAGLPQLLPDSMRPQAVLSPLEGAPEKHQLPSGRPELSTKRRRSPIRDSRLVLL